MLMPMMLMVKQSAEFVTARASDAMLDEIRAWIRRAMTYLAWYGEKGFASSVAL